MQWRENHQSLWSELGCGPGAKNEGYPQSTRYAPPEEETKHDGVEAGGSREQEAGSSSFAEEMEEDRSREGLSSRYALSGQTGTSM